MPITQITAGLIADGAVTANTLNSTQTFTVNNLTVTNTASVVTLVFADNTVQTTAYTGTNAQAYDQSLNTYNDVVFHNITSTGTISSENFYVGGTEGGSFLFNNDGEFLISNAGHNMMTVNFAAQVYNDQLVGAVTFNAGRVGIYNSDDYAARVEFLNTASVFYTPIIATTATFNDTVNIVNTLTIGNYSIAPVDGIAGQALVTDGMGQVSFQNIVPSLDFGSFIAPAGFTLDMGRFI